MNVTSYLLVMAILEVSGDAYLLPPICLRGMHREDVTFLSCVVSEAALRNDQVLRWRKCGPFKEFSKVI
jgi:hypothetical protein